MLLRVLQEVAIEASSRDLAAIAQDCCGVIQALFTVCVLELPGVMCHTASSLFAPTGGKDPVLCPTGRFVLLVHRTLCTAPILGSEPA